MMQLVLTVMAIGLAALLVAGGINYFSTDIGVRVEVAQALRAQHDSISAAVSTYRSANNGFVHHDIARLKPYLPGNEIPGFPRKNQPLSWSVLKNGDKYEALCLSKDAGAELGRAAAEGFATFASDHARKLPNKVRIGNACRLDALSTLSGQSVPADTRAILIEGD